MQLLLLMKVVLFLSSSECGNNAVDREGSLDGPNVLTQRPQSEAVPGILWYGLEAQDTLLYPITDDDLVGPIITPLGVTCDCVWSNHLYVSVDGYVVLGKIEDRVESPSTVNMVLEGARVVAPLWTDLKIEEGWSYMWYHVYYRYDSGHTYFPTILDELYRQTGGSQVWALQAVVVTWEDMVPASSKMTGVEYVTFQLVLLSDAVSTYVVFNYISSSWMPLLNPLQRAIIFWRCENVTLAQSPPLWSGLYPEVFLSTNVETPGAWLLKLGNCPSTNVSYSNLCVETQTDREVRCPCLLSLAQMNHMYTVTDDPNCYGRESYDSAEYELCCYNPNNAGTLLVHAPLPHQLSDLPWPSRDWLIESPESQPRGQLRNRMRRAGPTRPGLTTTTPHKDTTTAVSTTTLASTAPASTPTSSTPLPSTSSTESTTPVPAISSTVSTSTSVVSPSSTELTPTSEPSTSSTESTPTSVVSPSSTELTPTSEPSTSSTESTPTSVVSPSSTELTPTTEPSTSSTESTPTSVVSENSTVSSSTLKPFISSTVSTSISVVSTNSTKPTPTSKSSTSTELTTASVVPTNLTESTLTSVLSTAATESTSMSAQTSSSTESSTLLTVTTTVSSSTSMTTSGSAESTSTLTTNSTKSIKSSVATSTKPTSAQNSTSLSEPTSSKPTAALTTITSFSSTKSTSTKQMFSSTPRSTATTSSNQTSTSAKNGTTASSTISSPMTTTNSSQTIQISTSNVSSSAPTTGKVSTRSLTSVTSKTSIVSSPASSISSTSTSASKPTGFSLTTQGIEGTSTTSTVSSPASSISSTSTGASKPTGFSLTTQGIEGTSTTSTVSSPGSSISSTSTGASKPTVFSVTTQGIEGTSTTSTVSSPASSISSTSTGASKSTGFSLTTQGIEGTSTTSTVSSPASSISSTSTGTATSTGFPLTTQGIEGTSTMSTAGGTSTRSPTSIASITSAVSSLASTVNSTSKPTTLSSQTTGNSSKTVKTSVASTTTSVSQPASTVNSTSKPTEISSQTTGNFSRTMKTSFASTTSTVSQPDSTVNSTSKPTEISSQTTGNSSRTTKTSFASTTSTVSKPDSTVNSTSKPTEISSQTTGNSSKTMKTSFASTTTSVSQPASTVNSTSKPTEISSQTTGNSSKTINISTSTTSEPTSTPSPTGNISTSSPTSAVSSQKPVTTTEKFSTTTLSEPSPTPSTSTVSTPDSTVNSTSKPTAISSQTTGNSSKTINISTVTASEPTSTPSPTGNISTSSPTSAVTSQKPVTTTGKFSTTTLSEPSPTPSTSIRTTTRSPSSVVSVTSTVSGLASTVSSTSTAAATSTGISPTTQGATGTSTLVSTTQLPSSSAATTTTITARHVPFGASVGDSLLAVRSDDDIVGPISAPIGFACQCTWSSSLYVSVDGFVLLGSPWETAPPSPPPIPTANLTAGTVLIAPLWSDMRLLDGTSSIWYQMHYRYLSVDTVFPTALDLLYQSITRSTDVPVQAFVVTWHDMLPMDADDTSSEFVSFQLVMLTDAVRTYTVYNYISTSWQSARDVQRPAAVVWQCSDTTFYDSSLSAVNDIYNTVLNPTISGTPGQISDRLDHCSDTYINPANLCYRWVYREEGDASLAGLPGTLDTLTTACPCNQVVVEQDSRFTVTATDANCYSTVFATNGFNGQRICCYDDSTGALLTSLPAAGFQAMYHPSYRGASHQREDRQMFVQCCQKAGLCNLFARRRPVDNCERYVPSDACSTYGEPHILTVDGRRYTYNGLGEFTLLQILDTAGTNVFQLQGRAEILESVAEGRLDATVFTAIAGQDKASGGYFQVEINLNKDGFVIYTNTFADPVDSTLEYYQGNNIRHDGVMIRKISNTSMRVVFQNGIGVDITLTLAILDLALLVPPEFRQGYSCSGLLGNNDGDQANDFQLPNGTVLADNISDQEIYAFGEAWRVEGNSSIVTYRAGFSYANFQNASFVPIFLSDFSLAQRAEATTVCGNSDNFGCIFDYLVTGDTAIANATQVFETVADQMVSIAKNHPPVCNISQPIIQAEVGQPVEIVALATEVDGQNLTLYLTGLTPSPVSLAGTETVTLTYIWTPVDTSPVNVSVYATDSLGISSHRYDLEVLLCPGCVNGRCDYPTTVTGVLFTQVACKCDIGWTGSDCSEDKDGCQNNPCGQAGICTDLSPADEAASAVAFSCSCSAGYQLVSGYRRCQDIDECTSGISGCDQGCENAPGSHTCVCDQGYLLIQGQCVDIDECLLGTSHCQQTCTNTEPGYQCSCLSGYILNSDNRTCNVTAQQQTLCEQTECEQGCLEAGDGTVNCICDSGYTLAADKLTCEDVDECAELVTCVQVCNNKPGSFDCGCYAGYTLSADGLTCKGCAAGKWGIDCQNDCNQCLHLETCDPTRGCTCRQGWEGPLCDTNIDECRASPGPCADPLKVCKDTEGLYVCECAEGYELMANGTCQNIDECGPLGVNDCPLDMSLCVDQIPGYLCRCKDGYRGDGYNCTDIDECVEGLSSCDQVCIDKLGSHNCDCFPGYKLNDDRRTCSLSADPCYGEATNEAVCQLQGADGCKFENDQAQCFCKLGYIMQTDGSCQDIDECLTANLCSEICINTAGGFRCSCNNGSRLAEDQVSCQACNITSTWGPNCQNQCDCGAGSLYCDSLLGCVCSVGWSGSLCDTDIDECKERPCAGNQTCVNSPAGSYTCNCPSGFEISADACIDVDECSIGTDLCSQRCVNQPSSYSCACRSGYEMTAGSNTTCTNINECELGSDGCSQICEDVEGSFLCSCHPGFLLMVDKKTCEKDGSADSCANVTNLCNYGCKLELGQPVCFCQDGYQLNAFDKTSCQVVFQVLSVTIVLDLEYKTEYATKGSQQYKNVISDLRAALLALYVGVTNISDVRIDHVLPPFEVQHSVVFHVANLTDNEVAEVAKVLKDYRDSNQPLVVGTVPAYVVKEPTVKQLGDDERGPVTCLLCDRLQDCIFIDVDEDRYSCAAPRDELTTVDIEMSVGITFLPAYTDMLSSEYVQLAGHVRQTLRSLFQGVDGFAGLGDILFSSGQKSRNNSLQIQLYVKFNSTVQTDNVMDVAEKLTALLHNKCLQIGNLCAVLFGEILLLQKPAVCWTCDTSELCLDTIEAGGQSLYTCVPLPRTTPAPATDDGSIDLLLGLGLGFPLTLLFTIMCVALLCYCSKRRPSYHGYNLASSLTLTPTSITSSSSSDSGDISTISGNMTPFHSSKRQMPTSPDSTTSYNAPLLNLHSPQANPPPPPVVRIIPYRSDPPVVVGKVPPSDSSQPVEGSTSGISVGSQPSTHVLYKLLDPRSVFQIRRPQVNAVPTEIYNQQPEEGASVSQDQGTISHL